MAQHRTQRHDPGSAGEQKERPAELRLPDRSATGHKGTFGTVCVVAGSMGYTGAAYLAATGAARAGAGYVRLLAAEGIYPILAIKCTEVVVTHRGFAGAQIRDLHDEGWSGCLANLEREMR